MFLTEDKRRTTFPSIPVEVSGRESTLWAGLRSTLFFYYFEPVLNRGASTVELTQLQILSLRFGAMFVVLFCFALFNFPQTHCNLQNTESQRGRDQNDEPTTSERM